ncbi:protein phosphatase 1 regulatory subunit 3B [Denticeps clupeoides]|uniref:Protein phosphatase 1 regulatory subunit n=1 Tax=Denticeps clupeoides TaxID=299321 RepID=A0AAY4EEK1_9TELE|nr:protein phosphatase 1 regulatory subunit 3B [Denticeps clupeoides]
MPVELAMPLYIPNDDFCYRRTPRPKEPTRPCLHPCGGPDLGQLCAKRQTEAPSQVHSKKRVSFADHRGLALTRVKVFSEFDDPIDIPLNIQELLSSALTLSEDQEKLVLDFEQPSSDYLLFRQRLEEDYVCLEHCMLKEKSLAGTIKVKNLAFEKSVKVRITFDTWKTHTDVLCQYMKDTYTDSDRDTFSFEVCLPNEVQSHEHIEFAVLYEVGGHKYWDSNQGQNYKIIQSILKRGPQSGCFVTQTRSGTNDWGIHFDRYGSPTCSHGLFPEWPSYAAYEDFGPYY